MVDGPDFSSGVVWWFTHGQPEPGVLDTVALLLAGGELDWVIVPIPIPGEA
jgi:hypothetical protein